MSPLRGLKGGCDPLPRARAHRYAMSPLRGCLRAGLQLRRSRLAYSK
jgi:hypothetical protein